MTKGGLLLFVPESDAPHQAALGHWVAGRHPDRTSIVVLPLASSLKVLQLALNILRIWQMTIRHAPRAIYICSPALVLPAALALLVLPRLQLVYHSQDWLGDELPIRAWLEGLLARRAKVVIWNEQRRAVEARRRYRLKQLPQVVPTFLPKRYPVPDVGADLRAYRIEVNDRHDRLVFFAGGGYSKSRLSPELCDAWGKLANDDLLLFTGDSPRQQTGAIRNAVFLGRLSHAEFLRIVAASDVGLLLYKDDGFGNRFQQPGRLTEYLRCGTPVLASNFPAVVSVAQRIASIEICEEGTVDSISRALLSIRGRVLRGEFSKRAIRKFARDELSLDSYATVVSKQLLALTLESDRRNRGAARGRQ